MNKQRLHTSLLFWLTAAILSGLLANAVHAATSRLTAMGYRSDLGSSRLVFDLTETPEVKLSRNGQRIEIRLGNTDASPTLRQLPENDRVVRVMLARQNNDLVISILLRRVPTHVASEFDPQFKRLNLDIAWGEQDQSRPGIAFHIPGIPSSKTPGGRHSPRTERPLEIDWEEFFQTDITPLEIKTYPEFTLPQLPPLVEQQTEQGQELANLIGTSNWAKVVTATADSERPSALTAQLEALLHLKRFEDAENLLRKAGEKSADPRRIYLHAWLQSARKKPFIALLKLNRLHQKPTPWPAYAALLECEIQLSLKDAERAEKILQTMPQEIPGPLKDSLRLRRIDLRALNGSTPEVMASYRLWLKSGHNLNRNPFSLERAAWNALHSRDYKLAESLYQQLEKNLAGTAQADLAHFGRLFAKLKSGGSFAPLNELHTLGFDQRGTEAGVRAEMSVVNFWVNRNGKSEARRSSSKYAAFAKSMINTGVREEALFRQALTLRQVGDDFATLRILETLKRSFNRGRLRQETDTLLIELLPGVITALLQAEQPIKALGLLERNRQLVLAGSPDRQFLSRIATHYRDLGLLQKAMKISLYLLDHSDPGPEHAALLGALAEMNLQRGEWNLAADYAGRLVTRYPDAATRPQALELQIRALLAAGNEAEVKQLIDTPSHPTNPSLNELASRFFWERQDYSRATAWLAVWAAEDEAFPDFARLLQAEALLQLHRNGQALPIFQQLRSQPEVGDQASYRTAQLLYAANLKPQAITIFTTLADQGSSKRWRLLASQALADNIL